MLHAIKLHVCKLRALGAHQTVLSATSTYMHIDSCTSVELAAAPIFETLSLQALLEWRVYDRYKGEVIQDFA